MGIEFEEGYVAEQHAARAVSYADRLTLEQEILRRRMDDDLEEFEEPPAPSGPPASGGMGQGQMTERYRAVTASQARRKAATADGLEKEGYGIF